VQKTNTARNTREGGVTALSRLLGSAGLFADGFFREIEQRSERFRIGDREIGERLAVEADARLLEAVHEDRVRHAFATRGRVDAADPQRAEIALAHAAVAKRVSQRLEQRFVRDAVVASAGGAEALDELHDFAAVL